MPTYCAVVVGGSLSGLLAARALADHCERVLVVDRDTLPDAPAVRRCAAQGAHVHALLDSGREAIDALLPRIFDDVAADGGHRVDIGRGLRWYHAGSWRVSCDTRFQMRVQSRPLLEHHVRERVSAIPGVEIRSETTCTALLTSDGQVRGVRLHGPGGDEAIEAGIVVDAAGRGSQASRWLVENGYAAPPMRTVELGLGYASRLFERPPAMPDGIAVHLTYGSRPTAQRHGLLMSREDVLWHCTLMGYHGDHAPTDDAGFLAWAQTLEHSELGQLLAGARPVSEVTTFKVPRQVRRDFHRVDLPEGLVVMGDAACALDPVFGQGMSVAAQQALALEEALAGRTFTTARFARTAATIADRAWLVTTLEATRYPQARKAFGAGLLHRFLDRVVAASGRDPEVYRANLEVVQLHRPATWLARPRVLWRLLVDAFSRMGGGGADVDGAVGRAQRV